ncbi:hypothetical protein DC627_02315 [Salmonella enterica]|uniref:Uncharacterized protein n=1 Tax=Salmonella enterica TaxID=28901 RepID=A0A5Y4AGW1_SALER|nr:hypothetical protein [Salmonella enterica subsp. enterica serovar Sandiego]EAM4234481.1 hypothetical protein [Salmonella enterica]EDT4602726.1 hypothetical protein [Salmonella enterica subsp. enterica serovar Berta]EDU9737481.1 hypothetical protein [Salmonella enterica subsp. enterica]EAO2579288.1 hypothetical protein [Salmonella enterica]
MDATRELYKLGFEISPVILCDGVAQSIPGGMLPIVALTQSASYVSGLMGGAIELTDLDKYFCHWRAAPGGTMVDYDIGRYPFANQAVAANALLSQPLRIPMLMDAPVSGYISAPDSVLSQLLKTCRLEVRYLTKMAMYTVIYGAVVADRAG